MHILRVEPTVQVSCAPVLSRWRVSGSAVCSWHAQLGASLVSLQSVAVASAVPKHSSVLALGPSVRLENRSAPELSPVCLTLYQGALDSGRSGRDGLLGSGVCCCDKKNVV